MIINTIKIDSDNTIISGYFLTIKDLAKLVRDFDADCRDGFVSNDETYIESWLKSHEQINDFEKE